MMDHRLVGIGRVRPPSRHDELQAVSLARMPMLFPAQVGEGAILTDPQQPDRRRRLLEVGGQTAVSGKEGLLGKVVNHVPVPNEAPEVRPNAGPEPKDDLAKGFP